MRRHAGARTAEPFAQVELGLRALPPEVRYFLLELCVPCGLAQMDSAAQSHYPVVQLVQLDGENFMRHVCTSLPA